MEQRAKYYQNKPLSFDQVGNIATELSAVLRSAGYIAGKVIIPEQAFRQGGNLYYKVIPGVLDTPEIKNSSRFSTERLTGQVSATQCGQGSLTSCPANVDVLTGSAMLLNEMPGIAARYSLEPGTKPGTTRVVADVRDAERINGYAGMDNHSNEDTGKNRYVAGLTLSNLTGFGDRFRSDLTLSTSGDLFTGSADYSFPVGLTGMRAGVNYAHTDYVLNGQYASLQASGKADTYTAWLSKPVYRTPAFSADSRLEVATEETQDDLDYFAIHQKRQITHADASLSGNVTTEEGAGSFSYGILYGNARLRDDYSGALDELLHTAGNFAVFHHDTSAEIPVMDGLSFWTRLHGQFTSRNLSPSHKFVLGGPDGVRAYGSSDGVLDQGHIFSAEVRRRFSLPVSDQHLTLTAAAFFDQGWGEYNRHSPGPVKNFVDASAAGLWLGVTDNSLYEARATWAQRTGNAITTAQDRSQFWLSGYLYF
ncbi:TPA: ShlB/FhaC/HecB family hemolysin secretion/activation protein [Enterobacter roggenkampii]